jgi:hypothetical protein
MAVQVLTRMGRGALGCQRHCISTHLGTGNTSLPSATVTELHSCRASATAASAVAAREGTSATTAAPVRPTSTYTSTIIPCGDSTEHSTSTIGRATRLHTTCKSQMHSNRRASRLCAMVISTSAVPGCGVYGRRGGTPRTPARDQHLAPCGRCGTGTDPSPGWAGTCTHRGQSKCRIKDASGCGQRGASAASFAIDAVTSDAAEQRSPKLAQAVRMAPSLVHWPEPTRTLRSTR